MSITNAQTVLDDIAADLSDAQLAHKVGRRARENIQAHINTGTGFDPLSPATIGYRGQGRPLKDTGTLLNSIAYEVVDRYTVRVGTNLRYAAIHNSGGTVNARKHWLFIPAAGVRQLERHYGKKPGDVIKGLKGSGHSVWRQGRTVCARKNGRSFVVYYLKKSVKIPKREFFYLSDEETDRLLKLIAPKV